jgi:hypothetical protein
VQLLSDTVVSPMSTFECWQLFLIFSQTAALFWAVIVALSIGRRQNAIAQTQAETNAALLELQYSVSVVVVYNRQSRLLTCYNSGHSNVQIERFGWNERDIHVIPEPILLPPWQSYNLDAAWIDNVSAQHGPDWGATYLLQLSVRNERREQLMVRTLITLQNRAGGSVLVHTQTGAAQHASNVVNQTA